MWRRADINPCGASVGDCAVRAVALATGQSWREAYRALCDYGYRLCDMPSANRVFGAYLTDLGYTRQSIPEGIVSLRSFCRAFPRGTFVVVLPQHVCAVIDGDYLDSWDSGAEEPLYFFRR